MSPELDDFDSRKRKVQRYTQAGHHVTPFGIQVLLGKELDQRKAA